MPLPVAGDRLSIDDARPDAQPRQSLNDQGEAVHQVIAGTAVEPHPLALLAGDDPEAVALDLVQPKRAGGRFRSWSAGTAG